MYEKIKILQQNSQKVDYWLFHSSINRFWLTNFQASDGLILFDVKNGKLNYFLDPRYWTEAQIQLAECQLFNYGQFYQIWRQIRGQVNVDYHLPVWLWTKLRQQNQHCQLNLVNFNHLRIIKTAEEVRQISRISQQTAQIWEQAQQRIDEFQTEQQIANYIHQEFVKRGCQLSFTPIVATDKRTAFIHTQPTNCALAKIVLCDFGGKWTNYCSDFTRTVILDAQSPLKLVAEQIVIIYEKILKMLKPGVPVKKIVEFANQLFAEQNWKLEHALGHGIGLKVHEEPTLSDHSELVLQPNMVLAIEPGVYFPGLGGVRHEDTILITKTGYKILTKP